MRDSIVLLSHGAGGKKSAELMRELFFKYFKNPTLEVLGDSAVIDTGLGRIAFTTDSFVVQPISFPGGDIGKLAVCGTVNDLAAAGAHPLALTAAFILEEGLSLDTLESIVASMHKAALEAGINIVAGDTKVVPRGSADKLFITTSGIGMIPPNTDFPSPDKASAGDVAILSGTIADHGMAVMTCREGIRFSTDIHSDCAPLNALVSSILEAAPNTHCLRDPTRGGLAAVLNELAQQSGVCIQIDELSIPVNDDVRTACELLGIDPLYVANEGKMVVIAPEKEAEAVLAAMQKNTYGKRSAIIGKVLESPAGKVHLKTVIGTTRIVDMPAGDLLPRIC